jgi:hypothetical protein
VLQPTDKDQRRRVTVAEAEADYFATRRRQPPTKHDRRRSRAEKGRGDLREQALRRPMGFSNEAWERLKAEMRPGDELWEFCSARSSWDQLTGMAGYELIRDGTVVAALISRMN